MVAARTERDNPLERKLAGFHRVVLIMKRLFSLAQIHVHIVLVCSFGSKREFVFLKVVNLRYFLT